MLPSAEVERAHLLKRLSKARHAHRRWCDILSTKPGAKLTPASGYGWCYCSSSKNAITFDHVCSSSQYRNSQIGIATNHRQNTDALNVTAISSDCDAPHAATAGTDPGVSTGNGGGAPRASATWASDVGPTRTPAALAGPPGGGLDLPLERNPIGPRRNDGGGTGFLSFGAIGGSGTGPQPGPKSGAHSALPGRSVRRDRIRELRKPTRRKLTALGLPHSHHRF